MCRGRKGGVERQGGGGRRGSGVVVVGEWSGERVE